jgi:hypothetical protein
MRLATLPDKPIECNIEESFDPDGVTLSWPSKPVTLNLFLVTFLAFWLCGWFVSLVYAVFHLHNGGGSHTYLIVWLCVWTIAAGFALRALRAMFRPSQRPSVRLEAESLQYDSGDRFYSREETLLEFARSEVIGVVLDRVGGRLRLRLDLGDLSLEIGESLREPEREWMFKVLQNWYNAEPPVPPCCGDIP